MSRADPVPCKVTVVSFILCCCVVVVSIQSKKREGEEGRSGTES